MSIANIAQRHNVGHLVRKHSEIYLNSNKTHDIDQGEILVKMSDDIMAGDSEMASLRLDALHHDIKKSLPFEVLDWLNKPEFGLDS